MLKIRLSIIMFVVSLFCGIKAHCYWEMSDPPKDELIQNYEVYEDLEGRAIIYTGLSLSLAIGGFFTLPLPRW